MKRAEILRTAETYITQDRAATHGNAEDNFATIAKLWSVWAGMNFTAHDVAMMMCLFKIARTVSNLEHTDNYIDLAGYCAIAGELATNDPS